MIKTTSLLITFLLLTANIHAQEHTADEEAVWQLEQLYWHSVMNKDAETFKSIWDRDTVSWNTTALTPSTSMAYLESEPPRSFAFFFSDPNKVWSYELEYKMVRAFGDVVAAHYIIRHKFSDAATGELLEVDTTKIMHTWQRRGDTWQIITGMSGRLPDGT